MKRDGGRDDWWVGAMASARAVTRNVATKTMGGEVIRFVHRGCGRLHHKIDI